MKFFTSLIYELFVMLVALSACVIGAEADGGASKEKENNCLAVFNQALDSPDGLSAPAWLPKGENRNGLIRLLIWAGIKVENKVGFFAGVKKWWADTAAKLPFNLPSPG